MTRLRRKIEADPREPRFLHTVRGRGYVLKPGRLTSMHTRIPGAGVMKRFLPRSLLGRSLLMILLPLVLLQAVALQIFYGSHLDLVSRRLSGGVDRRDRLHARPAAVSFRIPPTARGSCDDANRRFDLMIAIDPRRDPAEYQVGQYPRPDGRRPDRGAEGGLHRPFTTDWVSDPHSVLIHLQMPDGVLTVVAPRKRLYTGTIYPVRRLGGRHRAAAVRDRRAVHAQPGARHPPPGRGRRGVRPRAATPA